MYNLSYIWRLSYMTFVWNMRSSLYVNVYFTFIMSSIIAHKTKANLQLIVNISFVRRCMPYFRNPSDLQYVRDSRLDRRRTRHTVAADSGYSTTDESVRWSQEVC